MSRRYLRWFIPAALAVGAAIYFISSLDNPRPGQPAPHAIDQSE